MVKIVHCGWWKNEDGWTTALMLSWGVDEMRWFLAFSTCGWNVLSERALHQRCEAVGVDVARQGVWKQPVYKTHLDKGQLGGTTQNTGAPEKDESTSRVGS